MALSMYFNLEDFQTLNNSEFYFNEAATPQDPHHLFPYTNDQTFFHPNTALEFDPTNCFLYPETYFDPLLSLPNIEDYSYNYNYDLLNSCPKRQKIFHEEQEQRMMIQPNFLDGFVPNNNVCSSLQAEEVFCSVPEFKAPQDVVLVCDKKESSERTISPQSIAARERRRRITEKTQELGNLVPGGPKMNTAEMLQAAAKYVKYLQAQVGMLQLMNNLQEEDEVVPSNEDYLHSLVVSPFVQEKLYSEEKCFVPTELVTTLTNHDDLQSRPSILDDLKKLIEKKPKQD